MGETWRTTSVRITKKKVYVILTSFPNPAIAVASMHAEPSFNNATA
jgi:hypothetical protein